MIKLFLFFFNLYFNNCDKNIQNITLNNQNQTNNAVNFPKTLYFDYFHKKNLIIGIIKNYPLNIVLPFFESLLYANFKNCDVVMFVKNVSQLVKNYLKKIGIIIYEISEEYHNFSLTYYRWKLYINLLEEKKNDYNQVFICDVRDTFFQKDIFQYYKNKDSFLGVSLEDGTLNETKNKKWIIDFAGNETHKKIQNERIICFGTIWGSLDKLLKFLKILWENLKSNTNSTDQGIGNYLLYSEKIFEESLIKSDNFGPVMTIGLTERKNLILDKDDNLLNFKGEIASVVHQYDRKSDIVLKVNEKFVYSFISRKRSFNNNEDNRNIFSFFFYLETCTILLLFKASKMKRHKKY